MLALCTNLFYDGVIEVTQVMRGSLNRTLQITQGAKKMRRSIPFKTVVLMMAILIFNK